ncbi:hypothetical protein QR685DRAFT_122790 [Neurospora intermedia]|uniref:Secreted protein n=1 Tax=Neurospora intermedia TaxID=5142 RepID=A0ABR3CZ17_NEUIN
MCLLRRAQTLTMAFPGTAKAEACVLPGTSSDDQTLSDWPVPTQRSQKTQFRTGKPKGTLTYLRCRYLNRNTTARIAGKAGSPKPTRSRHSLNSGALT